MGGRFVMLGALYAGPIDEGERMLRPLLDVAEPLVDFSGVMPYVDVQRLWDADYPDGMRYYWKSLNLTRLDDEVIARIARPCPPSAFAQEHDRSLVRGGGAGKRAVRDECVLWPGSAVVLLNPESNWVDPADDARNIAWVRQFIADMEPYSDGSRYLNFAGFQEEGDDMMRASFGPHYARLLALKRRYDPTNLFRLNQNIDPASG